MKVKDVLDQVNTLKPHPYSAETLVQWLSECEGMAQTRVMLQSPVELVQYSWPESQEWELLVDPPHDKLYVSYLLAMIDYHNGEYGKYQNSMAMFNAQFSEFSRWFATVYRPADNDVERRRSEWE